MRRHRSISLNWGDIISKVVVTLIPLTLGWIGFRGQDIKSADITQRHDSLLVAFTKSAPIDTIQNRQIRSLQRRRGTIIADTLEVRKPNILRRWWAKVPFFGRQK